MDKEDKQKKNKAISTGKDIKNGVRSKVSIQTPFSKVLHICL